MSTRDELTLQAERCLRQGRMDEAIALYQDLAHLEPVEWGLVKLLADLLERAGQREGAARQFARWADYVFAEGFHSKAAALYKKVLKLEPADEHALWQLGEVSIALKLRADARVAFQRVVDLRLRRGDAAGAALAAERRDALDGVAAVPLMPSAVPPAYAAPRPEAAAALVVDAPAPAEDPPIAAAVMAGDGPVAPSEAPAADAPIGDAPSPAIDPVLVRAPDETAPLEPPDETPDARWQEVVDDDPEDFLASDAGAEPKPPCVEVPDSWGVSHLGGGRIETLTWPGVSAVDDLPQAEAVGGMSASSSFDWGELLGRTVESTLVPGPPSAVQASAVAVDSPVVVPSTPAPAPPDSAAQPRGAAIPPVTPEPPAAPLALLASPEPALVASPEPALPAPPEPAPVAPPESAPVAAAEPGSRPENPPAIETARSPRIGDLRAQPLYLDGAPLQPSFSMPRTWLSDAPALPPDAPRRRPPEDDFFFMDDATPARWAPPQARALAGSESTPAPFPTSVEEAVEESTAAAPEPTAAIGWPSPGSPSTTSAMPSPQDEERPQAEGEETVEARALADEAEQATEPAQVWGQEAVVIEEEVDLTQLLEELKQWDPELPEPLRKPIAADPAPTSAPAPMPVVPAAADEVLDAAFADLQRQGDGRAVAEQQLAAGRVFLAAGLASEAARAFERASGEPRSRFEAALALAELHRSRSQLVEAVAWYELAATAPVPDAAVKRAVLYDLAESLEALGETERAVGVLLDLLSQVEDYRDARGRLDRLLRVDAGG